MLLIRPLVSSSPVASGSTQPVEVRHWHWARSTDGRTVQAHGQATTAEVSDLGRQTDCVLVIPLIWLSWHRVQLPAGRSARSADALRGLLEERVLDDPGALHWALDPEARRQRGARAAWVAACRRELLDAALEPLLQAGCPVHQIVPEAAPMAPHQLWAFSLDGAPHVAVLGPDGLLVQPVSAVDAWSAMPDTEVGEISAWAEPAVLDEAQRAAPSIDWTVAVPAQIWLQTLAAQWDLAQFDLRRRVGRSWRRRWHQGWRAVLHSPPWRPARWGVMVLVLTPLLALPGVAWQAQRQTDNLRDELTRAARQALPGTPVLLDPARQVRQALDRERQRTGTTTPHPVEVLLDRWGDSADLPRIMAVTLDRDQLDVTLQAPTGNEPLQAVLAGTGWRVASGAGARWQLLASETEAP